MREKDEARAKADEAAREAKTVIEKIDEGIAEALKAPLEPVSFDLKNGLAVEAENASAPDPA